MPRFCSACGKKLTENELVVCNKCLNNLKETSETLLRFEFARKFASKKIIDEFYSLYIFDETGPIRKLLHGMKYGNKFKIGTFLGERIAAKFRRQIEEFSPDLILPVPLHSLKKAERGYNQSYYIARGIAKVTDVHFSARILKRKVYTETQTHLSASARKENVKGVFMIASNKRIAGAKIILVDDVTTTGATASSAAFVLKQSGAKKIMLLTAAIPLIE